MTKFGADLIQAMSEALVHAQAKDVPGAKVYAIDLGRVDAKAIRKKRGLNRRTEAAPEKPAPTRE